MKKFIPVLFIATAFFACSENKDLSPDTDVNAIVPETNLPVYMDEYGKLLASSFTQAIHNLRDMGVDYSDAEDTEAFRSQFISDWQKANPATDEESVTRDFTPMDADLFADRISNFTEIQLEFLQRIYEESNSCSTYDELYTRLISTNSDIAKEVPVHEQERLFYVTTILYYCLGVIQQMEDQGLMINTPINALGQNPKTRSGALVCTRILAPMWAFAVFEPTPAGEVVTILAAPVILGGMMLYQYIACKLDEEVIEANRTHCIAKYAQCMDKTNSPWNSPNSGGWGKTMCYLCMEKCLADLTIGDNWRCPVSI
jgi:hypothetical protein